MGQLRVEKVQELMKQEISEIILRELKDPRIGFVTVTSVECTGDLREAKVYVSLMGSEQQVKDCWAGLISSLGFIRREIGRRIRLRFTPEITFTLDKSLDYSAHIQELLLKVQREEQAKGGSQAEVAERGSDT